MFCSKKKLNQQRDVDLTMLQKKKEKFVKEKSVAKEKDVPIEVKEFVDQLKKIFVKLHL